MAMDDSARAASEVIIVLSNDEAPRCALDVTLGIALLHAVIEKITRNNRGRPKSAAFVIVSVDNMASIKSLFGFEIVEVLLTGITSRLRDCLRASDVIGRLSDDQLGIVLPSCRHNGAAVTVDRVLALRSQPITISHGPVDLKLSAASVAFPGEDRTAPDVITRAQATLSYVQRRKNEPLNLTRSIR
jgi:diguanylate cyclase (GGDEF)-like protein